MIYQVNTVDLSSERAYFLFWLRQGSREPRQKGLFVCLLTCIYLGEVSDVKEWGWIHHMIKYLKFWLSSLLPMYMYSCRFVIKLDKIVELARTVTLLWISYYESSVPTVLSTNEILFILSNCLGAWAFDPTKIFFKSKRQETNKHRVYFSHSFIRYTNKPGK